MSKLILLTLLITSLSGCITLSEPRPNDPAYAPVPLVDMQVPPKENGAIYQEGYSLALFETIRARRVGDILTITLVEKTDAEKKATSSGTKTSSSNIDNPTILGSPMQFNAPGFIPLVSNVNNNLDFNLDSSTEFSGEGESKQNNKLDGMITVTVTDVLPNGNLVVRGEKWIHLNRGKEYIRLTGIVRPADIKPDNSVDSYRVADARIDYGGTGQVAKTNVMGWLAKFFIGRFWPF